MLFQYLSCFLTVCEQKSFSKAAKALYIGPPAVSKQMGLLEAELDVVLFVRTPRGVQLTSAGKEFYKAAKRMTDEFAAAVNTLQKQYSRTGCIRLGVRGPDANAMIPAFLAVMQRCFPRCEVTAIPIRPAQTEELLCSGAIDLSFTHGFDPQRHFDSPIGYLEIIKDKPVCFVPPVLSELKAEEALSLDDLVPYTLLIVEKGTSDFHDDIYQEIEERRLPIKAISVVEGDIAVPIQQGLGPTISIGPSLLNGAAYAGFLIPFLFHNREIPLGLLCRKEDVPFYQETVLLPLREAFADLLTMRMKK